MARLNHLNDLLVGLQGDMPATPDWARVIALANKTLCTPALSARLMDAGHLAALPSDVHTFLREILTRNEQRNQRLLDQLDEACAVMNAHGTRPILLKGSAWLASTDPDRRGQRMLADLDIMVPTDHFHTTIEQLSAIGYQLEFPALRPEVPAVLWRPQDAGTIDLHTGYGGGETLFYQFTDLACDASPIHLSGSTALLPSAVACASILLLHDQLKGRDYLRGRIDLRHLIDIQHLVANFDDLQWQQLDRLFRQPYAHNAMKTQLLTARKMLRIDVPDALVAGVRARLQYWRRLVQIRWPMAALPLTLLSMLDPSYLAARREAKQAPANNGKSLPRRESLKRLFFRSELGKI
ncbi:nucleotidyltransferase family protein [Rhizorhapis sp. SPR117]|uniref:nucleotidyltransferase family protein n=1 Tax=Rhizorhapis sp. SPR117 TaxID=2912611 RepID=UPI001F268572|nr:nucleotidyltransferase family protein [Rhizorhapis sp. SPR117]